MIKINFNKDFFISILSVIYLLFGFYTLGYKFILLKTKNYYNDTAILFNLVNKSVFIFLTFFLLYLSSQVYHVEKDLVEIIGTIIIVIIFIFFLITDIVLFIKKDYKRIDLLNKIGIYLSLLKFFLQIFVIRFALSGI